MGYWKKRWQSQNRTVIIEDKYHSRKMMPKNPLIREKRSPRTGRESQKRINLRHRTEKYSRLIIDNFRVGDWWVTFKLTKNVSLDTFKKAYSRMLCDMRTFYQKHGHDLKYLAVHENLTGRGRLHGHILIPALPGVPFSQMKRMMEKAWKLGDCHFKPYEGSTMDAIRIAGYMTKEDIINTKLNERDRALAEGREVKTLDAEIVAQRSRICPSKNLIRTEAVKKPIRTAETYRDEIKAPKGYHVVKELSYNGWTEDGFSYQHAVYEKDG